MRAAAKKLLLKGTKSPFPHSVKPMLCTLTKTVIADADYIHEIKFDGYRIVAFHHRGKTRFDSRSGLNYTAKYPSVVAAFKKIKHDVVMDGEVCALNSEGRPDFDTLQKPNADSHLVYYAFDLLWINGYSLKELPLRDRKAILRDLLTNNDVIRYSDHFDDGVALFRQTQELGMEGIVSKRYNSEYIEGNRGNDWLKTPTEMRQEYVIGGWTESDRDRPFASLLFGAYKGNELHWLGHAGGGFKDREMPEILSKLKKIEIKEKPFINKVEYSGRPHWVKPKLVANFKFATFTKRGRIRKPAIFLGFRTDKPARSVVPEVAVDVPMKRSAAKRGKKQTATVSNWPAIESEKITERDELQIKECKIPVTNGSRMVWPGIPKVRLMQYYHDIHRYIIPHISNRPLSLHIKPKGANAPGLYIKDMEGREPNCASVFSVPRLHRKPGKRDIIDYLVCNNEATLLYQVNLGCIDINPWTSRTNSPDSPDYIVIDLDPSDEDFKKAVETAKASNEWMQRKKIKAFVKTSGKTGLHVFVPCAGFNFTYARTIAENICSEIHGMIPNITTTEVSVSNRGNKLYLDPNQNDYADTVAAAYSVRPYKVPTVSTPIEWNELKDTLVPTTFTIDTIPKRLAKRKDIFGGTLDKRIAATNTKILMSLLG
jgi:bifunctional non-homologous end joining protein LigD